MKHFDFECKKADADAGTFTGYAAVFGNVDHGGHVIEPGAFAEIVRTAAGDVVTLWQHEMSLPIGLAQVAQDERGLKVAGRLILADPQAQTALVHMKAGSVRGLSIGYEILPGGSEWEGGVLRLKKLKLWETSLVTLPMNAEARVHAVKSAMACDTVGELEDLLRESLILPSRKAKRIASACWPIIAGREAPQADDLEGADLGPLADEIRSLTQLISQSKG